MQEDSSLEKSHAYYSPRQYQPLFSPVLVTRVSVSENGGAEWNHSSSRLHITSGFPTQKDGTLSSRQTATALAIRRTDLKRKSECWQFQNANDGHNA